MGRLLHPIDQLTEVFVLCDEDSILLEGFLKQLVIHGAGFVLRYVNNIVSLGTQQRNDIDFTTFIDQKLHGYFLAE